MPNSLWPAGLNINRRLNKRRKVVFGKTEEWVKQIQGLLEEAVDGDHREEALQDDFVVMAECCVALRQGRPTVLMLEEHPEKTCYPPCIPEPAVVLGPLEKSALACACKAERILLKYLDLPRAALMGYDNAPHFSIDEIDQTFFTVSAMSS